MSWFSRPKLPPVAEAYRSSTPKKFSAKQRLDELEIVVLDAETTGFHVQRDTILSLAAVTIRSGQLLVNTARSWMVFQPNAMINEAAQVHGILPSDTRSGIPQTEVLDEFLPMLNGALVVGHHIQFDANMLNVALQRRFGIGLLNPLVDTAALSMKTIDAFAKTGYANQRPPTLDEVCTHAGIALTDRHTAVGDAFTTAELFLLLCARLRTRLKRPLVMGDLPLTKL